MLKYHEKPRLKHKTLYDDIYISKEAMDDIRNWCNMTIKWSIPKYTGTEKR